MTKRDEQVWEQLEALRPGDDATATVRGDDDTWWFLGFSGVEEKYDEEPRFESLENVRRRYGCHRREALEYLGECRGLPYGHGVRAVFDAEPDTAGAYKFAAYLFEGRWVVGSSADPITRLRKVRAAK